MKKSVCLVLSAVMMLSVTACGSAKTSGKSSAVQSIIKQAEGMSMEELAKKPLKSPMARCSTAWATLAAARARCLCSSSISSPSIPSTN